MPNRQEIASLRSKENRLLFLHAAAFPNCLLCGKEPTNGASNDTHHLRPVASEGTAANGIVTLCPDCHKAVHTANGKFSHLAVNEELTMKLVCLQAKQLPRKKPAADTDADRKYKNQLAALRWNGKPVCPYCKNGKSHSFSDGSFRCAKCMKKYTVLTCTFLAQTKIPLSQWFRAIELFLSTPQMSARFMAVQLFVTVKTATAILDRLRQNRKQLQEIGFDR